MEEELQNMQEASSGICSSNDANYKISVQYQLLDFVGIHFDALDGQMCEQADLDF